MTTKIVKLNVMPTKEVLRQFATALGKSRKGEKIEEHSQISFESVETLGKVFTKRKI